jgi:hypothetical protein
MGRIIIWVLILLLAGLGIALAFDIWLMAEGWSFFFGYFQ